MKGPMRALLFLAALSSVALAQSQPVRVVDPVDQSKSAGVTNVGGTRGLNVYCIGSSCAGGGSGGSGWTPDGGNIGFMRMPDGGPLEVFAGGSVNQGLAADGGVGYWTVRPTSSGTTGSAVPTTAIATGFVDASGNMVVPRTYDTDNSGGVQNSIGVVLLGTQFGGASQIGGEPVPITGIGYLGLVVNPIRKHSTVPAAKAVSCGTAATAITASPLAYRVRTCFYNNSAATIFIGATGVTVAAGYPINSDGGTWCDDTGSQSFSCIVATGTGELRVLEN